MVRSMTSVIVLYLKSWESAFSEDSRGRSDCRWIAACAFYGGILFMIGGFSGSSPYVS